MKNYLLSSLIPFINDDEISYYGQLNEDVVTYLISLAPFVDSSENLRKLSNLTVEQLVKATEILPLIGAEEKEKYFDKL